MKIFRKYILVLVATTLFAADMAAQQSSQNTGVRRRERSEQRGQQSGPQMTKRMQSRYSSDASSLSEGDVQWMRVIYRQLDLDKDENAALYFPEEPIDGQENLFRIIMRLLADNAVPAYEYLDGREIFTDQYRVKVRDVLDRFHILYTDAKGSTEKNPKFAIMESDVPTNEVLSYYLIERWEYDNRGNRLKTYVEAVCPVLHRAGDFGGEPVKYPMFWIKFADLRPYLAQQMIFVNDDNNLPTCTYDDYFNLTMYKGDIYKTRNLRNKSMMQLYPDPDDLKRAQDSIQARLDGFENKLWVPDREEIIAAREKAEGDSSSLQTSDKPVKEKRVTRTTGRSKKKSTKVKETKVKSSSASSAVRSVRRKKR